jgi:hypothetical protein
MTKQRDQQLFTCERLGYASEQRVSSMVRSSIWFRAKFLTAMGLLLTESLVDP